MSKAAGIEVGSVLSTGVPLVLAFAVVALPQTIAGFFFMGSPGTAKDIFGAAGEGLLFDLGQAFAHAMLIVGIVMPQPCRDAQQFRLDPMACPQAAPKD